MSIQRQISDLAATGQDGLTIEVLLRCLTLNGKVEEADALRALSPLELMVLAGDVDGENTTEMVVGFRPHGRALICDAAFADAHVAELSVVRRFTVPDALYRDSCAADATARDSLEAHRAEIFDYFGDRVAQQAAALIDSAEHMAPLIFYIGDQCFSNFYEIGRSSYPREHELRTALAGVIERGGEAPIEALTLAYVLALLNASGSYTRPEEMNSGQLTIPALTRHFYMLALRYQALCGLPSSALHAFSAAPLTEQADQLARWRTQASASGRFVREINGLNLLKKERYLPNLPLADSTRRLTQRAQSLALIEDAIDNAVSVRERLSSDGIVRWLRSGELGAAERGFTSDLEYVIDAVVRRAIEVTCSDVGMTRGTRSFAQFFALLDANDAETASRWTQTEYFCHAVPSRALDTTLPPKAVKMLLNAVSARMRYNTWHYIPSYFDAKAIPADRGWFHAPRMADLAEWSDQHHTGHVHASVRYSIRSPQPIRVRDRVLLGFIDLRLMRQQGERYTMADLGTAIAYTEALGLLYQALADHVLATGSDFTFRFGDKQWVEARYLAAA